MYKRWLLLLVPLCIAPASLAHPLNQQECSEVADFLGNAARSREGGMSRETFISRMRDDIQLIQAFPPELRWVVQDEADATMLLQEVVNVFDHAREPEEHSSTFAALCVRSAVQEQN